MRRCALLLAVCAAACGHYTAKATVTIAVSGPGAVRSPALQGDCRVTCWFSVARDTPVHLEPVMDGAAAFAGWSGACSGTATCDLKPGTDVAVAATFMPGPSRHLNVSLNGAGTVHSDPAGIDCPQICGADFPLGTPIRLQASAPSGWDFTGFGGACAGAACSITLSGDVSAWATFVQRPATLSVELSGNGSVLSSPAGIDCPRVCSAAFVAGSTVTLTATPAPDFNLQRFSGACSGGSCSLRLSADVQVLVAFTAVPTFNVLVVPGGLGRGRVESVPAGIDCPGTCSARFPEGAALKLWAAPDALSKFGRYEGSCTGTDCAFTLRRDMAIVAGFDQRRYVAMDLGTPSGGWWSTAVAISPHGLVAGNWGGTAQAFAWDGSMHDLGIDFTYAYAINDSGTVAGSYLPAPGVWRGFRWQAGTMTELPTLGGPGSYAYALNESGVAVGWAERADGQTRAVSWTGKAGAVDLGSLAGGSNACSFAYGINADGIIVGESCKDTGGTRAVRYRSPGVIDDLGTIGGYYGRAQSINDAGVIVGSATNSEGSYHGFVYSDGMMNDAGTLPGFASSQLLAVNSAGVAVGIVYDAQGGQRAVIYGSGRMLDLAALTEQTPYTLSHAYGIDDSGNIAAEGMDRGSIRALLLKPQ